MYQNSFLKVHTFNIKIKLQMISFIEENSTMEQPQNTDTRATNENSSQTKQQNVIFGICGRTFRTNRGLVQHLNFCQCRNSDLQ